jgi:hypothetical protein
MGRRLQLVLPTLLFVAVLLLVVEQWRRPQQRTQ